MRAVTTNMHASFIFTPAPSPSFTDSYWLHASQLFSPSIHPFFTNLILDSHQQRQKSILQQLFRFYVFVCVSSCASLYVCVPECFSLSCISFLYELKKKMLFISAAFQLMPFTGHCRRFAHTKLGCWLKCEWPFARPAVNGKKAT